MEGEGAVKGVTYFLGGGADLGALCEGTRALRAALRDAGSERTADFLKFLDEISIQMAILH